MTQRGEGFEERVATVLRRGRQRGFLTASELVADLDDLPGDQTENEGRWETLMRRLAEEGIRVVEEVEEVGPARRSAQETSGMPVDPVGMYLKEIGRYPLLTPEQEVELAVQIENGVRARDRLESDDLPPEERKAAARQVEQGETAYHQMVESNLRLVVSMARRTFGSLNGANLLDLIQEGNMGLMKAARKFDHRRGFRFSTYAGWWIRQPMIKLYADQSRAIRLPAHLSALVPRLREAQSELTQKKGRAPTTDELATRLDLDPAQVDRMLRFSQRPVSLQQPVGSEGEGATVGDLVEDSTAQDPFDVATLASLQRHLAHVLKNLRGREQEILRLRFGLEDGRVWTLAELSRKFRVTKERIRQMERRALSKIRYQRLGQGLLKFLED